MRHELNRIKLDLMKIIRKAVVEDSKFIVQSQLEMAKETENLILNSETVEKGVAAVFQNPAMGGYYVAENENKELIGCLLTLYEWSEWRNGNLVWVHSVYIVPSERRSGVFRAMYAHLKEWVMTDPALRGLRLYVERKNAIAQKVYESLGMTKEHYELYEWLK